MEGTKMYAFSTMIKHGEDNLLKTCGYKNEAEFSDDMFTLVNHLNNNGGFKSASEDCFTLLPEALPNPERMIAFLLLFGYTTTMNSYAEILNQTKEALN